MAGLSVIGYLTAGYEYRIHRTMSSLLLCLEGTIALAFLVGMIYIDRKNAQ